MTAGTGVARLAPLIAGLSLAADLGLGQPLEHTLRTCLRSLAIGRELHLPRPQLQDLYHVALLRFIGCTATSEDDVREAAGDELRMLAALAPVFNGSTREVMPAFVRAVGVELPARKRAVAVARALANPGGAQRTLAAHCEVATRFAERLGMSEGVRHALSHAYERWDGKGFPDGLAGEDVPLAVRIVVVARDAELWAAVADPDVVADVLRSRRGHAYAPQVVDAILAAGPIVPLSPEDSAWDRVLDSEPEPVVRIDTAQLDEALVAFADFADLKSPYTRGHSREVATLARDAATAAGLDDEVATMAYRAGLVHDLGRVGIPLSVWDRPAPLTQADRERVRLHPYYTERILAPCTPLTDVAAVAGRHHERLTGDGYHRGCGPGDLGEAARVLAVADAFQAMTQERAFRGPRTADTIVAQLRREADEGRLASRAVEAVLAIGDEGPPPQRASWPGGLTDREVEVLRLTSRGRTNKQVAAELFIAPKTVGHHLEHIYRKLGVSTRGAAALFAMENHLL